MNSGGRSAASRVSSERIARLLGRNASRAGATVGKTTDRGGGSDSGAHNSSRASGDPADLEEAQGPAGTFLARRHVFERDTLHGSWRLGEVQGLDARAFSLLCADETLAQLNPERAVYLDTETTGLSGGAGTYVFMVGLGWFDEGVFRVWQGFLGGPEQERALLAETARRIAAAESVVSFFGKSFDRHRLEDKMRIVGVDSPFINRPHLDLYHPLRRVNGGQFEDNRLQTLEKGLLGLQREQDLPGCLAPAAWFDYLGGREHHLEGVFHHNLLDVLSLVALTAHLGLTLSERRPLAGPGSQALGGCAGRRAWALGRAFWDAGQRAEALDWMGRALTRFEEAREEVRERRWRFAECLRLEGRDEAARLALEELTLGNTARDACALLACEALAKLHEHGRRDLDAAAHWSREALALRAGLAPRASGVPTPGSLSGRLKRLERKLCAKAEPSN